MALLVTRGAKGDKEGGVVLPGGEPLSGSGIQVGVAVVDLYIVVGTAVPATVGSAGP